MSDELRIILATLGTISTLVLIPIIGLLFKWSVLLQKIAQTVYGENGNNGLKSAVKNAVDRIEQLERHLGRRSEDRGAP